MSKVRPLKPCIMYAGWGGPGLALYVYQQSLGLRRLLSPPLLLTLLHPPHVLFAGVDLRGTDEALFGPNRKIIGRLCNAIISIFGFAWFGHSKRFVSSPLVQALPST